MLQLVRDQDAGGLSRKGEEQPWLGLGAKQEGRGQVLQLVRGQDAGGLRRKEARG